MRRWLFLGLVTIVFIVAWAIAPPAVIAQLTGSVHDFTFETGPQADFKGTKSGAPRLCTTCHSPHGTKSSMLLWNHTLSSNTLTFGTGAVTVAGTELPTNIKDWKGTTKYCLSCHDGSVAVGDLIHGTDWGSNKITDTEKIIAPSGDLSGNHPVAIPYPYVASAVYNGITSKADPASYVSAPVDVKIYEFTKTQKGMECGSCHEVHRKNAGGPLLRKSGGTPSVSLCARCHNL